MAKLKNSDKTKAISLMNKISVLSNKGDRGEKDNAKKLLDKLLKKYNLKSIELDSYKLRTFKLADFNDCKVIMTHCILDTLNDAEISGANRKKELYCKLTDEQYIDVCEKFNHYYPVFHAKMKEYDSQRDSLVKAFLLKNNLGIVDNGEDNEENIFGIAEMMSQAVDTRIKNKTKLIS